MTTFREYMTDRLAYLRDERAACLDTVRLAVIDIGILACTNSLDACDHNPKLAAATGRSPMRDFADHRAGR